MRIERCEKAILRRIFSDVDSKRRTWFVRRMRRGRNGGHLFAAVFLEGKPRASIDVEMPPTREEGKVGLEKGLKNDLEDIAKNLNALNIKEGDDDDEEEIVSSVVEGDKKADEDEKKAEVAYTAKGPIRDKPSQGQRPNMEPYQRPSRQRQSSVIENDIDGINKFLDSICDDLNGGNGNNAGGIPQLPERRRSSIMNSLDSRFYADDDENCVKIYFRNSAVNAPIALTLDERRDRFGINVPRIKIAPLPDVLNEAEVEVGVQVGPRSRHIIKSTASIEVIDGTFYLKKQFLRLEPFVMKSGNGNGMISALLSDVNAPTLDEAHDFAMKCTIKELTSGVGRHGENYFMCACSDAQSLKPKWRARIYAMAKRLLADDDPQVRRSVVMKAKGNSAFDTAALLSNVPLAKFLAQIFYVLGEDLNAADAGGYTLLHLLARIGDATGDVLEMLLGLEGKDGERIFDSTVRDKKGQMPIHIAALADKCPQRVILMLSKDSPMCFSAMTNEGDLALHVAAKKSTDPTLLATLLHYNADVVNARNGDGMTALHLVASRNEEDDRNEVIALDEDKQIRMIRLLLDHGADKNAVWEGMIAYHVLPDSRTKAKVLLRVRISEANVSQLSPLSVHPPMNSPAGNSMTSSSFSSSGSTASSDSENEDGPSLDAIAQLLYHQHPAIRNALESDPDIINGQIQ